MQWLEKLPVSPQLNCTVEGLSFIFLQKTHCSMAQSLCLNWIIMCLAIVCDCTRQRHESLDDNERGCKIGGGCNNKTRGYCSVAGLGIFQSHRSLLDRNCTEYYCINRRKRIATEIKHWSVVLATSKLIIKFSSIEFLQLFKLLNARENLSCSSHGVHTRINLFHDRSQRQAYIDSPGAAVACYLMWAWVDI